MKRTAVMMAMAMLMSAGSTWAQESVAAGTTSPVQGGKVMKAKTMTATGAVKSIAADSLAISDGPGKDWTFVLDAHTRLLPKTGQDTVDVTPVSPVQGGKVIPTKAITIADIKEGQRVKVTYQTVDGKMHATQVRLQ